MVSSEGVTLSWDGRLDNRIDLISKLRLNKNSTDVEIVMAAYRQWEMLCFAKLIGDFALALWVPATETLLLARDAIGPRTLYYHLGEQRVMWATELSPLIDVSGTPIAIDDEYVAGFLTRLPMAGLTPYAGFRSVPPAHIVVFHESQVRSICFWEPGPRQQIRYRSDSDYEAQFRFLFRESISARLRVSGTAWAELSGGMDSSPIVCTAHELISNGLTEATNLQTVSRVYDEATGSDERKYIQGVETKIGRTGLHLREDDHRILAEPGNEYTPCIPSYVTMFRSYYQALDKLMKSSGARVLLTGFGGDEVQLGDGEPFPELVDLLYQGNLLKLHRRVRAWSESREESYWQFLERELIHPLLPPRLQWERKRTVATLLKFYNPQFIKRMDLRDRLFDRRSSFGVLNGSDYRVNQFRYSQRQLSGGFWRELCDIEFCYPFMHRPLVEFMLSIPAEQIARPGESKSLCKRALRDLLPTELINRKENRITIWHAASITSKREAKRIRRLFLDAHPLVYEYLDRRAVLSAFTPDEIPHVLLLSLVPFVEWLESIQKRRNAQFVDTRAA
jgi:asparagine synthase (glutamine-hydrolysing)